MRQQILKTLRCGLAVKRMNIEPVIEHFYVLDNMGGALCTFGHLILFLKIFIFRERGRKKERGEEKHECSVGRETNPGKCPDWESNLRPFGLQSSIHSTESQQPGLR